jgi:CDP-diacylglycerol--glycerol-3-phosphate 3-phosphatidyltransferase
VTKYLREFFRGTLSKIAKKMVAWGISPNAITIFGVLGICLAACFIALGNLVIGGTIVFFMGFMDALDGAVARANGKLNRFGAMLDSFSDRYSEILIYFGLLIHLLGNGDETGVILVFAALSGSVLVSYVRARAESQNLDCEVGIMTRLERYLATVVMLLSGYIQLGLLIIAILSHFTAIHRMVYSWRQIKYQDEKKNL